jgi:hypothetical protein
MGIIYMVKLPSEVRLIGMDGIAVEELFEFNDVLSCIHQKIVMLQIKREEQIL